MAQGCKKKTIGTPVIDNMNDICDLVIEKFCGETTDTSFVYSYNNGREYFSLEYSCEEELGEFDYVDSLEQKTAVVTIYKKLPRGAFVVETIDPELRLRGDDILQYAYFDIHGKAVFDCSYDRKSIVEHWGNTLVHMRYGNGDFKELEFVFPEYVVSSEITLYSENDSILWDKYCVEAELIHLPNALVGITDYVCNRVTYNNGRRFWIDTMYCCIDTINDN